ncbi:SWR1-complex protein 5 [Cladobotryum mycophilum]|uniref:SWR1-complex protein 5 n=1 Tax=Cladobotryum mycophilum TaxID=491253 RepID=A0ABR0SD86_9HYPO
MPPDPQINDDEEYASSQDSDFAPENAQELESGNSDSEDEGTTESTTKRNQPITGANAEQADDYENSGDEAIIEKGRKRQKRAKAKKEAVDDEAGEGGLIKTRSQRAAEKEERKYATSKGPVTVDVDAIWAEMMTGGTSASKIDTTVNEGKAENGDSIESAGEKHGTESGTTKYDESTMIRIKRTYNFAGRVHTEEKLVPRDSAEAKLFLASQKEDIPADTTPAKRLTKKAFRSAFEPVMDGVPGRTDLNLGLAARMKAAKEAQAKKLNTVEKSRMDWAGYVDKEGIKDELELAGKSKDSYAARQDFLARSEALRDSDAKRVRLAGHT